VVAVRGSDKNGYLGLNTTSAKVPFAPQPDTALPAWMFLGILSGAATSVCFCRFEIAAKRRGMKNRTSASEVSATLGFPSSETVQGLRLWKAFVRLSPSQRSEVLALVEQLATDPAPLPGGVSGSLTTR
jgi:hypothetical protein